VLAKISEHSRPWGNDYGAAHQWVHRTVQAAAPTISIFEKAVGGVSGSFDTRYVVLPKGSEIEINLN